MSLHLPYTARVSVSHIIGQINLFVKKFASNILISNFDLPLDIVGKELMSQDELAVMDGGKCILQLRGVRPFLSDKFDITKHPNYKYLSDYDKKTAFDIERFLSARLKLRRTNSLQPIRLTCPGDEAAGETGG